MKRFAQLFALVLVAACWSAALAVAADQPAVEPAVEPTTEITYHAVSADPALIERLGRKAVARLQKADTPELMLEDMRFRPQNKSGNKIAGVGTCLFILWDFTDHPADTGAHPAADYEDMFLSDGTYPTGSMNDYYQEVSHGTFSVTGTVTDWTTAANTYMSYSIGDTLQDAGTCRNMIIDAVAALDPVIDYSQFDSDGPDGIPNSGDDDGYVDGLFFIHSGPGEESSGDPLDIWSHAWGFYNTGGLATNDGVAIRRYSVEPEEFPGGDLITMGVFAHEYGHVLGLPDLYDTDYTSGGIGEWGLMSGGSWTHRDGDAAGSSPTHMTAWAKIQMGWVTPTLVTADMLGLSIPPAETNAVAYRVFKEGAASGDEYFLLENRRTIGFDEGLLRRQYYFGLDAPEGLIIYHVDEAMSGNSNDNHRLVDIVDASPWYDSDADEWHENLDSPRSFDTWHLVSAFNRGDNGDIWPGFSAFNADTTDWTGPRDRDTFSDTTVPSAVDYECSPTGLTIGNITDDGTNVTADISFSPATGGGVTPVAADVTWDFETDSGEWQFCNSFVHQDANYSSDCGGTGGMWFGLDGWSCGPGYGNSWGDFTWVTVGVDVGSSPQISITHRYDLESGYDYAYLQVRKAGDSGSGWTNLASYNGTGSCGTDTYNIPGGVLSAADLGNGVALVDVRLFMTSDGGWSAEDGAYCGIGWWVDEVSVTGPTVSGVGDLPGALAVARLEAPSPNPFNPATTLKYHIPTGAQRVSLSVYDQRGRKVRNLDVSSTAGWQEILWDGRDDHGGKAASGLYFAKLNVDGVQEIQKMALVK